MSGGALAPQQRAAPKSLVMQYMAISNVQRSFASASVKPSAFFAGLLLSIAEAYHLHAQGPQVQNDSSFGGDHGTKLSMSLGRDLCSASDAHAVGSSDV